jgi:teichuronic acid biosynthesis glycosyltransferase TuaG
MPAYDAGQYLEDAIKSVLKQTYETWELIIINDGSIDNTEIVALRYASTDDRIKLFNTEKQRSGASAARNLGVLKSAGYWIAFLDADDLWESDKLEKQMQLSKALPNVDVFYSSGWKFTGNDLNSIDEYKTILGEFTGQQMYKLEYIKNHIPTPSVIVKRSVIEQVGPQAYGVCEDWDYWLRMALCNARFYGMDQKLFYYRRHNSNTSTDTIYMRMAQTQVFVRHYKKESFTELEKKAIFLPLVNTLLIDLIKADRKKDARVVASAIKQILPFHSRLYFFLIGISTKNTVVVFYLFNRVYLKIKKILKIDLLNFGLL